MALLAEYISRDELAAQLGVGKRTIMRWQGQPDGLPFTMIGARVLYRVESVRKWLESRERHPNKRRASR